MLRTAIGSEQKTKGREASEVRAQMARSYGLPSLPSNLLYTSDLVKLVSSGQAQFSHGKSGGTTIKAIETAIKSWFFSPSQISGKVEIVQS